MSKYKAIIFDLDDTLYFEKDYVYSGFSAVSEFLSGKTSIKADTLRDDLCNLFTQQNKMVFNRLFCQYRLHDEQLFSDCISAYRQHSPEIQLREGVQELLECLKSNGYLTGIITDGRPEGQRKKIKALNIMKYFDHIIITDEVGIEYRKPSERPYIDMLEKLSVEADRAIYIGDNQQKDFIAAKNLGIKTIRVENTRGIYAEIEAKPEYEADFVFSDIEKVYSFLFKHI